MTDFERVMGYLLSRPPQETDKEREFGLILLLDTLESLAENSRLADISTWIRENDITKLPETYRMGFLRYSARWRREIPMYQEALSKSFDFVKAESSYEDAMRIHRGLLL